MKFLLPFIFMFSLMANAEVTLIKSESSPVEITLTQDNSILFNEDFSNDSVGKLMQDISKLNTSLKSGYPIYLVLYTPGGSIQAGLELYDFIKGINRPIHTITSFAASMGFQTVQQLGERYIMSNGILMSHMAYGGIQASFGNGFAPFDSQYKLWMDIVQNLDEQTVKRTNGKQTIESYRKAYNNELWLVGNKAIELGYADKIVNVSCDATMKGQTYTKMFKIFIFNVKVLFDRCPLNTNPLEVTVELPTTSGMMELNDFLGKGGQFGSNCIISDSYYDSVKNRLCASNPNLTLDMIQKAIEDKRSYYTRNMIQTTIDMIKNRK